MKIAYIAHPISGDVKENIKKIINIIRTVNLEEPLTVPFAPYIPDCIALNDADPIQRQRGISNDVELFNRGFIDELRLYGNTLSRGMIEEIKIAKNKNIPIRAMNALLQEKLESLLITNPNK